MKFRTEFSIPEGFPKIDHKSKLFLLGSCFVQNIGKKLDWFRFPNLQNPTGIIFHPSPINQFLRRLAENRKFTEKDIFEFNDTWQTLEAHSLMRRNSKESCLNNLNETLESAREYLKGASHLIISLGTAWGYFHPETGIVAANCHKLPQKQFKKQLSTSEEILKDLNDIISMVRSLNPEIHFIFTVSPVRHLKDGVVENQRSKAILISSIHNCLQENKQVHYFPSYEIMMDDLRDYRFYAEDLIHPNVTAIDYIWEKFLQIWMGEESTSLNSEIDRIQKLRNHRFPAKTNSSYTKILTKIQEGIVKIQTKHPEISFDDPL
ncbi:GSCFA domain-containing protein [Gramella sp. AN32]|uniref:GSCFA domain-containing protein n=1 Tax=Christiangramia antarctica TaxID=2058158 RepID=A0ABW5X908_9FLAO|nr:GSCFA domain-containing protein [Gramella sp. AN32]MCM4155273.1 GSCFA domain-containing protein [Gramella sp. AN32]